MIVLDNFKKKNIYTLIEIYGIIIVIKEEEFKMKKILGIAMATAMLLTFAPNSYADSSIVRTSLQPLSVSTNNVIVPEDPIITPFDVSLILPTYYSGTAAYEKQFYMDPNNGTDANIWMHNTGTTTVYMKVYVDNKLSMEVPFAAGQQKTIQLYGTVGHDYYIYVYNTAGAENKISISARQF